MLRKKMLPDLITVMALAAMVIACDNGVQEIEGIYVLNKNFRSMVC
jgi:hypothetical protein